MDTGLQNSELMLTRDGSHTVRLRDEGVTFHSLHGAITESMHLFIGYGFKPIRASGHHPVRILEAGFGTGLNALLTLLEAPHSDLLYDAIEPFPISMTMVSQLNYPEILGGRSGDYLNLLHQAAPDNRVAITEHFHLCKLSSTLEETALTGPYDLVYFDPFDPQHQPELWTVEMFTKLFLAMSSGAVLVTYSAKGAVRRAMQSAGFKVERLWGPPGKMHVTRAVKGASE